MLLLLRYSYAIKPTKSIASVKSMARYEKSIGKIHKAVRRVG